MSWHEDLKPYERGTQQFLGEIGHWHAVRSSHGRKTGRQWIKGRIEECQSVQEARIVKEKTA